MTTPQNRVGQPPVRANGVNIGLPRGSEISIARHNSVPFMFLHHGQRHAPAGITDASKVGRFPDMLESALDLRMKRAYERMQSEVERERFVTRTIFAQQAQERRYAPISGERDKELREGLLALLSNSGVGRSQSALFAATVGHRIPHILVAGEMQLDVERRVRSGNSARDSNQFGDSPARRVLNFASRLERQATPQVADPRLIKPLDASVVDSSGRMFAIAMLGAFSTTEQQQTAFEIVARAVALARSSYLETGAYGPLAAPLLGAPSSAELAVEAFQEFDEPTVSDLVSLPQTLGSVRQALRQAENRDVDNARLLQTVNTDQTALETAVSASAAADTNLSAAKDAYSRSVEKLQEAYTAIARTSNEFAEAGARLADLEKLSRESGNAAVVFAQRNDEALRKAAQLEAKLEELFQRIEELDNGANAAFENLQTAETEQARANARVREARNNLIASSQTSARRFLEQLIVARALQNVARTGDENAPFAQRKVAAADVVSAVQVLASGRWDSAAYKPSVLGVGDNDERTSQRLGALLSDLLVFELERSKFGIRRSGDAERRREQQARSVSRAVANLRNDLIVSGEAQALVNLSGRTVLPFALTYDFSIAADVDDYVRSEIISDQSRTLF